MKPTKTKVIITVLTLIAATTVIGTLLFALVGKNRNHNISAQLPKVTTAVPVDASAIILLWETAALVEFTSGENLLAQTLFPGDVTAKLSYSLTKILDEQFPGNKESFECSISLHYSARDKVSPLLSISIPTHLQAESLTIFENKFPRKRVFNNISIYSIGNCEAAIYNGFIVASDSPLILESSIRHLLSGASINDNEEFVMSHRMVTPGSSALLINHSQAGKLFSAFVAKRYLGEAQFLSRVTTWSIHKLESQASSFTAGSSFLNQRLSGNYVFSSQSQKGSSVESIGALPSNTFAVVIFSVDNLTRFSGEYRKFRDYYRKRERVSFFEALKWMEYMKAKEVCCAFIPYAGKIEAVALIKRESGIFTWVSKIFGGADEVGEIENFSKKGYLTELFGEIFNSVNEEGALEKGEYYFIGPKKLLEEIKGGAFDNFSLSEYFSQTKAYNLLEREKALVSVIVNAGEYRDSLLGFLNPPTARAINRSLGKKNIILGAYQIVQKGEEGPRGSLFFYADSLDQLPSPRVKAQERSMGWESDTIVNIDKGPFRVINFSSGHTEYLEQLPNLRLRLTDKDRKGIWAIPFDSRIKGYVEQVDYFKNGKLQMLFASNNKLYLLDRLGRFVAPFPVNVEKEIVMGPKVFKGEREGDYVIMLLHKDNSLRLYNRDGTPHKAWSDISTDETIKNFPHPIIIDGNRYWVLRTSLKSVIYTTNGNPVTAVKGRSALAVDTPVEHVGGGIVKVKDISNRAILLNLESGETKKVK